MKKILWISGLCLLASTALAGIDREILMVTTSGTATGMVTATNTTIRGWIDTIQFDVVTSGATGTLSLVAVSELSTVADVTLATKTDCAADLTIIPRFDATTTGGTAYTNNPAYPGQRFMAVGETLKFSVVDASATNKVFKCIIKYEK